MKTNYYSYYFECVQYEYFRELIDLIAAKCDSFSLETLQGRVIWSQSELDEFIANVKAGTMRADCTKADIERVLKQHIASNPKNYPAEKMLEVPYYKVLKKNYISANAIRLDSLNSEHRYFFKLNADTVEYIKKRRNIYDFDSLYSDGLSFPHVEDRFYSDFRLENIAFYKNGQCVLDTVSHESMLSVYDDEINNKLLQFKEIAVSHWRQFVQTWQAKRETLNEQEFIEFFVNFDYDYSNFMFPIYKFSPKVLEENIISPKNNYWYDQTQTLARIACEKVKRNDYANIHDLFLWYGSLELHDFSRPQLEKDAIESAREEVVTFFLLNAPEQVFISGFKTTMEYLIACLKTSFWIQKVIAIWEKRNLPLESIGNKIIAEFITVFSQMTPVDRWKMNYLRRIYQIKLMRSMGKRVKEPCLSTRNLKRRKTLSIPLKSNLAYRYYCGYGTKQNYAKAVALFLDEAQRGMTECQYDLAYCYEHGLGVEKDFKQAEYWYSKAKENGHPKAQERLKSLFKITEDREM